MDTTASEVPGQCTGTLRIGLAEKSLQGQVRAVGGRWDRKQQVWFVRYGCIAGTKLEKLIVLETQKNADMSAEVYNNRNSSGL